MNKKTNNKAFDDIFECEQKRYQIESSNAMLKIFDFISI